MIKKILKENCHIFLFRVEYFGDLENEERGGHESETLLDDTKPVYEKDAVTIKNIRLTNVSVFCDELKYENRPTQRMQDSAMVLYLITVTH